MPNDGTHNPIGAFSMSALSLAVAGVVSGQPSTLLFEDDFSAYADIAEAEASGNWPYISYNRAPEQLAIEPYPLDNTKNCVMIEYKLNEDEHVLATPTPTNLKHAFYKFREYRSPTWDAGPTKDFRWYSLTHEVDLYLVINKELTGDSPTGINPIDSVEFDVQGEPRDWEARPGFTPGVYAYNRGFSWAGGTEKVIQIEIKVNTPNVADAILRVWADDILVIEAVDFKLIKDGVTDYSLPSFQIGMTASNQGIDFAGVSKRYITDVQISEEYIP